MGKQRDLYKGLKRAKDQLNEVFERPEQSVVVHYSCESFYDRGNNPTSPRVTSLAIRNLDSGQTRSFSIHLVAERKGLLNQIDQHYDALELEMLNEFFDAARERRQFLWLHWNMRDANYGFEALENRVRALGGQAVSIPEERRYDLSRILVAIYGTGYIGHPRLESLMTKNHVTARDFLNGAQEAAAFENKEFVKLHQSTLRKVDILANLAGRAHANDLQTNSSWMDKHGRSMKATIEWFKEHWLVQAASVVIVLGAALYKWWPAFSAWIH